MKESEGRMQAPLAAGDILSNARSGDAAAFALLLDPLWEPAYRLALAMLRERQAAEDAVQEAALKAWRGIRKLRPDTLSIRPWFLTIVANQCRSSRRNRWMLVLKRGIVVVSQTERDEMVVDLRIDLAHGLRAIGPTPSRTRSAVLLRPTGG